MEQTKVRTRIVGQIQHMVSSAIIKDRKFLDDEQLIRAEQLAVLEEMKVMAKVVGVVEVLSI